MGRGHPEARASFEIDREASFKAHVSFEIDHVAFFEARVSEKSTIRLVLGLARASKSTMWPFSKLA
jgi:hypothetical protein